MRKKQKDDVMGEEESNLPINDGRSFLFLLANLQDVLTIIQFPVDVLDASTKRHISFSFRPEVRTNPQHHFSRFESTE